MRDTKEIAPRTRTEGRCNEGNAHAIYKAISLELMRWRLLTLATRVLGRRPRLPETGRSNELVKWKLIAFPRLAS